MSPYRKALVAVGGVLLVVGQALVDGQVTAAEAGLIATAVATAIGVFAARNEPEA